MDLPGQRATADEIDVREAGGYRFYRVHDLILAIHPDRAWREMAQLYRINPDLAPWELEHVLNHEHLDRQNTRADLRQSEQEVDRGSWFVIRGSLCAPTPDFSWIRAFP